MRFWDKVVAAVGLATPGMVEELNQRWEQLVEVFRRERDGWCEKAEEMAAKAELTEASRDALTEKALDQVEVIRRVQAERDQLKVLLGEHRAEVETLRGKLVEALRAKVEAQEAASTWQKEAEVLRRERDHALNQRDEARDQSAAWAGHAGASDREVDQLKGMVAAFRGKADTLERDLAEVTADRDRLEVALSATQRELTEARQTIADLRERAPLF